MVNITKSNFLTELPIFLKHLPTASYIAIDEEMTGISLPGSSRQRRPNKAELPSERYDKSLKGVPERYSILQVGVALFHKNPRYGKDDNNKESKMKGRDRALSSGSHRSLTGVGGDGELDGEEDENEDEHAYMHREGMLNQDELEDQTEREEEQEIAAAAAEAGGEAGNENSGEESKNDNENDENEKEKGEETEYLSRIYNFYLFPGNNQNYNNEQQQQQREMTLNPSTIKFLLENNMDFNKVFNEGIPYTTLEQATCLKKKYFERYCNNSDEAGGSKDEGNDKQSGSAKKKQKKNRVKLTRVEDIAFVARTMAALREWIDSDEQNTGQAVPQAAAGAGAGDGAVANGGNGGDTHNGANGENGNVGGNSNSEGTSMVLPPCNAFLRRCLYETIEDEYPGLILERADSNNTNNPVARNQIRVIRLSPAEKVRREQRLRKLAWEELLLGHIGFTVLFQAISDVCHGKTFTEERTKNFLDGVCPALPMGAAAGDDEAGSGEKSTERKVPLIVHNGLQDLMFLMTHCHNSSLPDSFEDTKKIIRTYFPNIYDTKIIGTEYSDAQIKGGSTALGDLFGVACNNTTVDGSSNNHDDEDGNNDIRLRVPPIVNQDGSAQVQQAHEASWDAYMTGCVFNALCNRILDSKNRLNFQLSLDGLLHDDSASESLLREWLGLNKLYMHASLFTIDLESSSGPVVGLHDPLSKGLSVDTTFHVSGITTSTSTRDIFQALTRYNEGEDEEEIRSLKYEIIWVDDVSFFVGTRMDQTDDGDGITSTEDDATFSLIASHVRNRLHEGLGNDVEISSLGRYLEKKYGVDAGEESSAGIVGSLVSVAVAPFKFLGSALRFGKRSSSSDRDDDDAARASKRRRLG